MKKTKPRNFLYDLTTIKEPSKPQDALGLNAQILADFFNSPLVVKEERVLEENLIRLDEQGRMRILYDPRRGLPFYHLGYMLVAYSKNYRIAYNAVRRICKYAHRISANNTFLWGRVSLSTEEFNSSLIKKLETTRPDIFQNKNIRILFEVAQRRIAGEFSRKEHEQLFLTIIGIEKQKLELQKLN